MALRMARLNLRQPGLPLFRKLSARLIADRASRRKFIAPLPWPNCLDDHARIVALLSRLDDRVERATPGAAQNIHRCCRVGPSRYGPKHFVRVGDIDVIIDDDNVPTEIRTRVALTGD